MKTPALIATMAVALLQSAAALCDPPLPKPAPVRVCSRYFCVDSTPGADTVFSCRNQPDSDRCHWSIPGWHPHLFVSNDGEVAVSYDGGSLLPLDYDPETVLVQLWKNGRMVRAIHASEVAGIRLRRRASHYEWGFPRGFDQNLRIIVATRTGKRLRIADPPIPSFNFFPPATIDSFRAQWYGNFLDAMQEPSLWARSTQTRNPSYRFLWLRSFHHPVVIRLEVQPDHICALTVKVGLGSGGFDPGMLIQNDTRVLTKEQSDALLVHLTAAFWSAPQEGPSTGGTDGAQWIIEGIDSGRYHLADRWSPSTGPIRDLGMELIRLASLQIPANELY